MAKKAKETIEELYQFVDQKILTENIEEIIRERFGRY